MFFLLEPFTRGLPAIFLKATAPGMSWLCCGSVRKSRGHRLPGTQPLRVQTHSAQQPLLAPAELPVNVGADQARRVGLVLRIKAIWSCPRTSTKASEEGTSHFCKSWTQSRDGRKRWGLERSLGVPSSGASLCLLQPGTRWDGRVPTMGLAVVPTQHIPRPHGQSRGAVRASEATDLPGRRGQLWWGVTVVNGGSPAGTSPSSPAEVRGLLCACLGERPQPGGELGAVCLGEAGSRAGGLGVICGAPADSDPGGAWDVNPAVQPPPL